MPFPGWSQVSLLLSDDFELLEEQKMPLLIREHRRKYEYIVAYATVWRRK